MTGCHGQGCQVFVSGAGESGARGLNSQESRECQQWASRDWGFRGEYTFEERVRKVQLNVSLVL